MVDIRPNDLLEISAYGTKSHLKVWFIDPISEAWRRQPDSRQLFATAALTFGADTKVAWVVNPDRPLYTPTNADGFPLLLLSNGEVTDFDGAKMKIRRAKRQ
jgi:hypothetical protein